MAVVKTSSFFENLKMAFATLRNNKLRSFLTIFGVIIGVITVMLISSIISGIDIAVKKQIESFGTSSIFLRKYDIKALSTGRRSQEERMRKPLTMEDADALANLSTIEIAVPFIDISSNFFGQKITGIRQKRQNFLERSFAGNIAGCRKNQYGNFAGRSLVYAERIER